MQQCKEMKSKKKKKIKKKKEEDDSPKRSLLSEVVEERRKKRPLLDWPSKPPGNADGLCAWTSVWRRILFEGSKGVRYPPKWRRNERAAGEPTLVSHCLRTGYPSPRRVAFPAAPSRGGWWLRFIIASWRKWNDCSWGRTSSNSRKGASTRHSTLPASFFSQSLSQDLLSWRFFFFFLNRCTMFFRQTKTPTELVSYTFL